MRREGVAGAVGGKPGLLPSDGPQTVSASCHVRRAACSLMLCNFRPTALSVWKDFSIILAGPACTEHETEALTP